MSDPTGAAPNDELDDDALDAVSGGAGGCSCPGFCFQHSSVGG